MSNASALAERMRKHVRDRGGLAKDDEGKPVIPNGAWAMMLEAADVIERQANDIAFAYTHAVGPLICARSGSYTKDGRMRLTEVKVVENAWLGLHHFTDKGLNDGR